LSGKGVDVFSILHRMIFREMLRVFLLSLLGITGILLMAGIVAEASQQGLSPGQIFSIIPLLIPSTLPYTIPATTLFATCVVYGRLSADNELLAIRASGINVVYAVWPGLLFGLITSGVTLSLYYHVIPYTHHLLRTMFLGDIEELLYTMLRKQNQISSPHIDYSIYVKSVQGRRLVHPVFKRHDAKGETDVVAIAHEAELKVDMNQRLILVHMRFGEVLSRGANSLFDDRLFDVPLPESMLTNSLPRARDMTWQELLQEEVRMRQEVGKIEGELVALEQETMGSRVTEEQKARYKLLRAKEKLIRGQIWGIVSEKQMRPALSLGCFFFVLIGCPVAIRMSKSDYLSAFITCFLPIIIVYYPLVLGGTSLSREGRISPMITIWAADAVIGLVGLFLFRRLLKN